MSNHGWDSGLTADTITDRIMELDVSKRTRDAMRAIVVSECERFASQTQDTIDALQSQFESTLHDAYLAREDATADLAHLATVTETHADAHIETIRMFSKRGTDRFVMVRADEREAGTR